MPEMLALLEKIMDIGKSTREQQTETNVIEIGHLWIALSARYHVDQETMVLDNFVEDVDLKTVMNSGLKIIRKQIDILEKWMNTYGVPLPQKPPESMNVTTNPEVITDEYIFRRVFAGMQGFLHSIMQAFIEVPSPKLRELFKEFLLNEIDIYDKVYEYGKFKGWISEPPAYRI